MKIGLFGCGAYAMALSSILSDNNCKITMWTKFDEEANNLSKNRSNYNLIPNYKISNDILITTNIEECINNKDLLIIAIPAAFVNDLALSMKPFIKDNNILIATKGIEQKTCLFMNEILEKNLNTKNIAAISGPTFAVDIVSKLPCGLSIAGDKNTVNLVKKALNNNYIKLKECDGILGIEILGAIKNVFAIGSGILDGMNANESTKSMYLTEALFSLNELLKYLNCSTSSLISYAGVGDLFLTCSSNKSRNFSLGNIIGQNKNKEEIDLYIKNTTVEGYYTLISIYDLLKKKNINIKLINTIYDIVINKNTPNKLYEYLTQK